MKIFLTSSANQVLDQIAPKIDKKPEELSVALIPTASNPYGENQPWVVADREKLSELGFQVFDFDIDGKSAEEVERFLSDKDIIFVAGGNVFYLLQKARESGFDKLVIEQIKSGKIYIGSSAGSILVGPDIKPFEIFDDPSAAQLEDTRGLGLVDFLVVPHCGKEKYKPYHDRLKKEYGSKYKFIELTDEEFIEIKE